MNIALESGDAGEGESANSRRTVGPWKKNSSSAKNPPTVERMQAKRKDLKQ